MQQPVPSEERARHVWEGMQEGGGVSRSHLERCLGHSRIPRVGRAQLKGADGATPPAGHSVAVNQLISDASKQPRRSSSETVAATLRSEREGKKSAAPTVRQRPPLKARNPLGAQLRLLNRNCCSVIFDQCEVHGMLTGGRDEIPLCSTSQRLRLLPRQSFIKPPHGKASLYVHRRRCIWCKTAGCYKRHRKKEEEEIKGSFNSLPCWKVCFCAPSTILCVVWRRQHDHLAGFSNHVCAHADFKRDGSPRSPWKSKQPELYPLSCRIRQGK